MPIISAFAPILVLVFATGDYAGAASVVGLLSLAAASLGAYYVVAIGTNLAQRTGPLAWTTFVAPALNVALNALLIPVWGMVGAGLASLAANLASTSLVYMVSQRLYPLPFQPLRILAIWLSGSLCVAFAGVFNAVARPSAWISFLLAAILLTLYTLSLFASRTITISEVRLGMQRIRGVNR